MGRPKKVVAESRPNTLNRSGRVRRGSIHGTRDKMTVTGQEAGWHYCWVNDHNVDRFLAGDYEFVTHPVIVGETKIDNASQEGTKISMKVGNDMTGYLMRVPEEFYDEDMEKFQEQTDELEETMFQNLQSRGDGRYGKLKVERGRQTVINHNVRAKDAGE